MLIPEELAVTYAILTSYPPKVTHRITFTPSDIIERNIHDKIRVYVPTTIRKGKGRPCTGTEALYRQYRP